MRNIDSKQELIKFINEEIDAALNKKSPFVSSIITQIKRYSGNKDAILLIGKKYENIISMIKNNDFKNKSLDSFDKYHLRLALKEIGNIDSLPTAAELVSKQLEIDNSRKSTPAPEKNPEQIARDEMIAQYGGEENYKAGRGLGT